MKWVDKIYIISLERHEERRNRLFHDLKSAGFDVSKIEVISAVNGNDLDTHTLINDGVISDTFIDPNGLLTMAIYGCAISHQIAYNRVLNSPDVNTALILEDDASLTHTALRTLLPESTAYNKFIDEKNNINWEVIMLGGAAPRMDYYKNNSSLILKKMFRHPKGYAAHSYIINKSGAEKLSKNNTPIRLAADTNIHFSDVELYCTPISYFAQKVGLYDRWTITKLNKEFSSKVLHSEIKNDDEGYSTTFGDGIVTDNDNFTPADRLFKTANVSNRISINGVEWKTMIDTNGTKLEDWANIKLKTNE